LQYELGKVIQHTGSNIGPLLKAKDTAAAVATVANTMTAITSKYI
jgi:hypothetical protein